MNPFQNVIGQSSTEAGAAQPTSAGIQAPMPQNVQPAPVPGMSGNPFSSAGSGPSALLASDAPGIFGLIGRMAGNPTTGELITRRYGRQQYDALQKLDEFTAQGQNPQQAIHSLMQTQQGMEGFMSSPDFVNVLRGWLSQTNPLPVVMHAGDSAVNVAGPNAGKILATAPQKMSPGEGLVGGNGNVIGQPLPTTDVQNLQSSLALSRATPEEAQQIGKLFLNKQVMTDPAMKGAAIQQLVNSHVIDPTLGAKIQSGVVSFGPSYDALGQQNGVMMYDMTKAMQTGDPHDAVAVQVGGANGGISGNLPAGHPGINPTDGSTNKVSGDIIFGAGMVGQAAEDVGGVFGNVSQHLAAPVYNRYKDQLTLIHAKVMELADQAHGLGGGQGGAFKAYEKIVDDHGYTANPIDQAQGLSVLLQATNNLMAYNNSIYTDRTNYYSIAQKKLAADNIYKLGELQQLLPSQDDLDASVQKAMTTGEGTIAAGAKEAATHVGEAVSSVVNTGKQLIQSGQGAAKTATDAATAAASSGGTNSPPDFKTEADALRWAQQTHPQPDENGKISFTINGRPRTLSAQAKK